MRQNMTPQKATKAPIPQSVEAGNHPADTEVVVDTERHIYVLIVRDPDDAVVEIETGDRLHGVGCR